MAEKQPAGIVVIMRLTIICSMAIVVPLVYGINAEAEEVEEWYHELDYNTLPRDPPKVTKLHFYFQDLRGVTTAVVAQSNTTVTSPTFFGMVFMADDPLTVSPSQSSKVIGRLQGMYGSCSREEMRVYMAMDFIFTDFGSTYNGSTLTVVGSNPELQGIREIPVVGGSGVFRMARGVARLSTYFFDSALGNATIECNVIVHHY